LFFIPLHLTRVNAAGLSLFSLAAGNRYPIAATMLILTVTVLPVAKII